MKLLDDWEPVTVSPTTNCPSISLSMSWLFVGSILITYPNAELVEPTTFSPCKNFAELDTISDWNGATRDLQNISF